MAVVNTCVLITLVLLLVSPAAKSSPNIVIDGGSGDSAGERNFGLSRIFSIFDSIKLQKWFDRDWFSGIHSFLPLKGALSVDVNVLKENGTDVWKLTLELKGYELKDLNATRQGNYFKVTGKKVSPETNNTSEFQFGQSLPMTSDLKDLSVFLENGKLVVEVPLKEDKMIVIPIRDKSKDLSMKYES